MSRRLYIPSQNTKLVKNSSSNNNVASSNVTVLTMNKGSHSIVPRPIKEFVIKQKIRREYTN